jgi:hypothetical protein
MKRMILIVVSVTLICCSVLYGQDQLGALTTQLQKTPTDSALREKIIKLAASMKPASTVPDEAIRFEGRAQYAFKSAKSEADYIVAAQEYEKAVAAAPWVSGYYSDLCTIYDKAGKPEDAKRNCGFYLVGLTDPDQITDAKRRIAGLEFAIEKANSPEAIAARAKAAAESRGIKTQNDLVGNWKVFVNGQPQRSGGPSESGGNYTSDFHYRFEPRGSETAVYLVMDSDPDFVPNHPTWCRRNGGGWACKGDEDLYAKITLEGKTIHGTFVYLDYNTEITGTVNDTEVSWTLTSVDKKGRITQTTRETLRKIK